MAATHWRKADTLDKSLAGEADRYAFFQFVRLIQRLSEDKIPVGRDGGPSAEAVRFASSIALGFPDSEIEKSERKAGDACTKLTVTFAGLTGNTGVLPNHYTDLITLQGRMRNEAMRDFFDMLSHRSISLLFRAWEKYRLAYRYENWAAGTDARDQFVDTLYALVGLGPVSLRDSMSLGDAPVVRFAGVTARRHRPGAALGPLLGEVFGVSVSVEPLIGSWLTLPVAERTRAGATAGHHARLSVDAVLGSHMWDVQGRFRVKAGPLTFGQFKDLLPDGTAFAQFCDLVRFYVGTEFEFDVELALPAEDVPACRIASADEDARRLGWDSWLGAVPENSVVRDTRLTPPAL